MKDSMTSLELDKILFAAAAFCATEGGRAKVLALRPVNRAAEANAALSLTEEALLLLFTLGGGRVESFRPLGDIPARAEKGVTLSCKELTDAAQLLRAARIAYSDVRSFENEGLAGLRALTERLHWNERLEREIGEKILGDDLLSDHASERLFELRTEIRLLNERIRSRLAQYLTGEEKKYLQDEVITVRGDRYVLPVKVEYKRSVRGFVHDRSASGATVFIEPEEILEMNNELRGLQLDEREETERILAELSREVGKMRVGLELDEEVLSETDSFYARAEYAYSCKGIRPRLNERGRVSIEKGRHPLLDPATAVPVNVSVGKEYAFLVVSGANTGGKTVTLKMCGLFCLMAACGLFVPAAEGTELSVFDGVYCDMGDSQSIEENLSTFSSHVLNLKEILQKADARSFVLIDEPGGGTDPEEGQAIARAVLKALLAKGCRGIVTTHYSSLKEFAFETEGMQNGCMEFDKESLRPLYRLRIGQPGSSNALSICLKLGLPPEIVEEARACLSEGTRAFERITRAAEESRIRAEEAGEAARALEREWRERLGVLEREEARLAKEKEKLFASAKAESRRIVASRTAEAEELLSQIEELFARETLTESDLIRARTLKNKLAGSAVFEEEKPMRLTPVDGASLRAGDRVYLGSLGAEGQVLSVNPQKKYAQVRCGSLQVGCKFEDLFAVPEPKKPAQSKAPVQVVRDLAERTSSSLECNVIGKTVAEAIPEVEAFLDGAVLRNLSEVRIVHGMGTGKLRAAIHAALKRDARVKEFRPGRYGEGESGVTVVTLR